jgi:hypothetical protein
MKNTIAEKDKEVKLFELKLKELQAVHKPLLTEEQNQEVLTLMASKGDSFANNYLRLRELGDSMMRRQQNNNLVSITVN